MRDAEGVPEHDVGVIDVRVRVGVDPLRETHGWFARGLGHVAACGVDLGVVVCTTMVSDRHAFFLKDETRQHTFRNMNRMSRKPSPLPNQPSLLGQQSRHLPTHKLVTDRLPTVRIQLIRVRHLPRPATRAIIVRHRLRGRRILLLLGVERIPIFVLLAPDLSFPSHGIDLEDGVLRSVNVGVDTHAEEMLMVVGVDAGVDFRAPAVCVFTRVDGVGVQDTGQFDLELNSAVLVQDPIDAVLVVCGREDVGDDEFAAAGHDDAVVAEVGVFE